MSNPEASSERRQPQAAPPELLILSQWEATTTWLFARSARWPKALRFSITAKIEALALEVLDELIIARYQRENRLQRLEDINLRLERLRFFARLARSRQALESKGFQSLIRQLNESGKMLHGWRQNLQAREPRI